MTDHTIALPPLLGTRERARKLVQGIPTDPGEVTVDCRGLIAATDSAADELVHQLTFWTRATKVWVELADDEFFRQVFDSADRRGVRDKVWITGRPNDGRRQ
jgi:hypothetical protein